MSSNNPRDRGNQLYRQKDYGLAIEAFAQALEASSEDLHLVYSNRCACYMQLKKFECALEDANACIRLQPNWAKGYSRLGSCLLQMNKPGQAIDALQQAKRLDPQNPEVQQLLVLALRLL